MIELRAAVAKGKPIVALIEPEAKHGGLTKAQIEEQLLEANANYEKWGFGDDGGPEGATLYEALFAADAVEWNRIGAFQDVTMRLLAQRLLPEGHAPVYVQGELISQAVPALPEPRDGRRFHAYCCPSNVGATELFKEIGEKLEPSIKSTAGLRQLEDCECMLVYLTAATWTSGEASVRLAETVGRAMDLEIRILLAHEMLGEGGQEARRGCDFNDFFGHPDGATPASLLQRGIYNTIAVALKGGPWREASMVMMAQALAEPPFERPQGLISSIAGGRLTSAWAAVSQRVSISGPSPHGDEAQPWWRRKWLSPIQLPWPTRPSRRRLEELLPEGGLVSTAAEPEKKKGVVEVSMASSVDYVGAARARPSMFGEASAPPGPKGMDVAVGVQRRV